jgi:hypothetical protein
VLVLILDAEALLLDDLERTGAIEYYRGATQSARVARS